MTSQHAILEFINIIDVVNQLAGLSAMTSRKWKAVYVIIRVRNGIGAPYPVFSLN